MKLAILGGSLLKDIDGLDIGLKENIETPYGSPSDEFVSGKINGVDVVYLNRHGSAHHIAPHQINYRANMFALKILEVTHIVSVTAVGGISEKMSPMKWVVPDQIIDYTYNRNHTYNDGTEPVNHIDFTYPFDNSLREKISATLKELSCAFEPKGTYGVTQGPRLETIAEINRLHNDGCDIVGMTAMPEACLARELGMNYSTLSLVVNWGAGKDMIGSDPDSDDSGAQVAKVISLEEMKQLISEGSETAALVIKNLIPKL